MEIGNTEKYHDEHKLEQGENAAAEKKSEGSSNRAQKVHYREWIELGYLNHVKIKITSFHQMK